MGHLWHLLALASLSVGLLPSTTWAAPEELGKIRWRRDFDKALQEAKQLHRPVLVLFDEVPGCQTVRAFGKGALSHPQIVEAAETLFVPVAIYNNVEGSDRRVLQSFSEPAWNNPVIRFIDADRRALSKRHAGDYSVRGLAARMVEALKAAEQKVPEYLRLLALGRTTERATLSMYCFWEGEAVLGGLEGVMKTRAGFLQGKEVVDVEIDTEVTSFEKLVEAAKLRRVASLVFARTSAQAEVANRLGLRVERTDESTRVSLSDSKYQLKNTSWARLPLSETQASRINSAVARKQDPRKFLSPRQLAALE